MFCGNCGKEIKDDSTFCPSCGEKIGEVSSNEAERQINANALSDSHVLRKYGYSSGMKVGMIFTVIILVASCIFCLTAYVLTVYEDSGNDSEKLIFLCMFVIEAICIIITSVRYSVISRMSLYICADKLYGTAMKLSYLTTKKFEVSYSDILDVKCEGLLTGPLVIETKMATYKCIIGKRQDAKWQIQNQMSSIKNQ